MKKLFRFTLATLAVAMLAFGCGKKAETKPAAAPVAAKPAAKPVVKAVSGLPAYAPKDTNVILYVNVARINSCVQKAIQQSPELKRIWAQISWELEQKNGLILDEMVDSEVCAFANTRNVQKDNSFQAVVCNHPGKLEVAFNFLVSILKDEDMSIGKIDGVRILQNTEMAVLLLNSQTAQFSFSKSPNAVVRTPLVKGNPAVAKDIDTGAMLSCAADLTTLELPEELLEDEEIGDVVKNITRLTLNVSDAGNAVKVVGILNFRDNQSCATAYALVQKFEKEALRELSRGCEYDSDKAIMKKIVEGREIVASGNSITVSLLVDKKVLVRFAQEQLN